jgi:hypothetical protein
LACSFFAPPSPFSSHHPVPSPPTFEHKKSFIDFLAQPQSKVWCNFLGSARVTADVLDNIKANRQQWALYAEQSAPMEPYKDQQQLRATFFERNAGSGAGISGAGRRASLTESPLTESPRVEGAGAGPPGAGAYAMSTTTSTRTTAASTAKPLSSTGALFSQRNRAGGTPGGS